jgi:hypothetical protein
MTAYITPARTGIPRAYALISTDRLDAYQEAWLLGRALFGRGFTYSVVPTC